MAEPDQLPVYILYLHTFVRKIYFTNQTGEDVTLMMPTSSTDMQEGIESKKILVPDSSSIRASR
jgi:hypothetical protein